jgi:branched-chain amino acid transport system permease protein
MLLIGQSLISGLLIGGLYAIIATGLSLTWGMLQVINLAHFSFTFLAAYITYQLSTTVGIDPFLTMLVTAPLFFVVGLLLQWFFETFDIEEFTSLLITFGLFIIFESLMRTIWTADYRRIPVEQNPYSVDSIWIGEIALPIPQFAAFIAAIGLATLTQIWLNRTYAGKALRAISQDREVAAAFGVNYRRMAMLLSGIATAYAAVAGAFVAMTFAIFPGFAIEWVGIIFPVVILGGLGSVLGVLAAGILIGVIAALTSAFLGPAMPPLIVFLLLIVALLFRPEGLFTWRERTI